MKKIVAALAFACTSAHAALIPLPGSLTPGLDTGVYGEQTCPPPVGCIEAGNTALTFNILNFDGSVSLSLVGVLDPSSTGAYTFDVEVFDPANILIASGIGSPLLLIPSFNVLIGGPYLIDIDWSFAGDSTTQTASWAIVAATSRTQVPEPGTLALLGLGLGLLGLSRRKV